MATVIYPAFAEGDRTAGYTARFPDLAECTAHAPTMAELIPAAREALRKCLSTLAEADRDWPEPTAIEDLASGFGPALLIDADIDDAPVRVNISIGERLLKRIDQAAEKRGMTRSGFIASAAKGALSEAGARVEWDSAKVQETLADYGRTLNDKFGPDSEFARRFADLDRKVTKTAETFATQLAQALRGKADAAPSPTAQVHEDSAETRP